MSRCWILLGMMGSGKSTVGRRVAELAGRSLLDTDSILQRKLGRPVHELFAVYGEEAFRDHETCVLRDLEPGPFVLATGGGIVLREENWKQMRRLGTTVYLQVDLQELKQRLQQSKRRRPLLEVENWDMRLLEIAESRRPLYERADLTVRIGTLDLEAAARLVHQEIERFVSSLNEDRADER